MNLYISSRAEGGGSQGSFENVQTNEAQSTTEEALRSSTPHPPTLAFVVL